MTSSLLVYDMKKVEQELIDRQWEGGESYEIEKMAKLKLSIIIPAYNEQDRIINTLKEIKRKMPVRRFDYEIVVVDDGSTDRTKAVIRKYVADNYIRNIRLITYDTNKGKGYAVRQGLLKSRYKSKLILDADHSVHCDEILQLKPKDFRMEGVIAGTRIQEEAQPLYRRVLGKIWQVLVWLNTGIYGDSQCPFKLCRLPKRFYKELKIDGFAYDVELLWKAKVESRLRWLKVSYWNNPQTKVTPRKTIKMFFDLLRI